jgi:ferric-dicitrate binding protein FerR (iron transport regulator)
MDYSDFDIADFVADERFVKAVLHPTTEEEVFWNQWILDHPEKRATILEARKIIMMMESPMVVDELVKRSLWSSIHKRIYSKNTGAQVFLHGLRVETKRKHRSPTPWYKLAAAIVIACGILYYVSDSFPFDKNSLVVLENKRAVKSEIALPDGSKVWLNAESRLTYPKSFSGMSTRHVYLTGEAYFDVTENKSQPFIVETSNLQIKVLGTVFNVKSYEGEKNIETTLVKGSVLIEGTAADPDLKPILLKEDERATYSRESGKISLATVQTDAITSWTAGKLVFINRPFSEIKTALERRYGVEIVVENEKNLNCRFSTTIQDAPMTKILDLFKATGNITYQIESNQKITIKGNLCPE